MQGCGKGDTINMYDELYELWKREKQTREIQRLPKDFYAKVAAYIKKMNEENRMLDKKTAKAKLLDNELQHAKVVVAELLQCRYEKFLKKALVRETVARDALTDEEKKLYGDVLPLPEAYQAFSKDILRGQLSKVEKGEKQAVTVLRFIQEIPALIGSDLKTYGPFAPEDIATLPPENARILIKQEVAVEVDLT
jgi:DNA replication initiation complex subunit (GINS family)